MHYYFVRHLTKFLYRHPVSESAMEVRMHPRSDSNQRCLSFLLSVSPRCRVFTYRDHLGNHVHHFDIPGRHGQLVVVAESVMEHQALAAIPGALGPDAWQELDALVAEGDYWEMLLPSEFAKPTPRLLELAGDLDVVRRDDPLLLLHEINQRLYDIFSYAKQTTGVDSPIDEALRTRQGVARILRTS
ncbi:MAG: transglutaminase N-terminal domain-containing protein [Acidobacteriaceae bacterium]